jgi:hypothetical protein
MEPGALSFSLSPVATAVAIANPRHKVRHKENMVYCYKVKICDDSKKPFTVQLFVRQSKPKIHDWRDSELLKPAHNDI